MKYRLVLQWPMSWLMGYRQLIKMEDTLIEGLGELGDVDGHDWGSGEMNIFIHTDDPRAALGTALRLLRGRRLRKLRAAYRRFDDDEYIPIYSHGLERFSVI